MKYLKIIGISLIVIIILTVSLFYYFNSSKMISGLEAIELTTPYANNWDDNAVLVSITANNFYAEPTTLNDSAGLFEEWFCTYAVLPSNENSTSVIQFRVFSNGTVIEQSQGNTTYLFEGVISNWIIDSDEAYHIAISDDVVKSWMQDHPNAKLGLFGSNPLDNSTWSISWIDKTDDNYGFLSADINAITGEIIVHS